MQFVPNGPEVPNELVQAHEDGRVVFFCGAGISYPAGLRGFGWLVDEVYARCRADPKPQETAAIRREQFDTALELLERHYPGHRYAVRKQLMQALKPMVTNRDATVLHEALLQLGRGKDGRLRLVTTNFDHLFETAANRLDVSFNAFGAPMLPIPKNSRWDGLVYLHGRLPDTDDESELNRLVVTSGDFGLAYLTERWASRFVSELFRNYVVCFVGYRINDPVIRYMMDALAADRRQGEATRDAWVFAPSMTGDGADEWEAKGVKPILYNTGNGGEDHSALYETLTAWAQTYVAGETGKEAFVTKHAFAQPKDSTRQDNFVGRMLWALSDKSGLPARLFAGLDPVPPLEWLLEAFSEPRYDRNALTGFGVPADSDLDPKATYSFMWRPPALKHAAPMSLVSSGRGAISSLDKVMAQIGRWLARHLNDPRLVVWLAQRGGRLHPEFVWQIERELDRSAELERSNDVAELANIRANAPNAIPSQLMRVLWGYVLHGRLKQPSYAGDFYTWKRELKQAGHLTTTLRLQLRKLLAPRLQIRERWEGPEPGVKSSDDVTRMSQLVSWQLALTADHVNAALKNLKGKIWETALPQLLDDLDALLRDALDIIREMGEPHDQSTWAMSSIAPHWQNRGFRDWSALIVLLRDAWDATHKQDSSASVQIARRWFERPYPAFKRLALYAASQNNSVPAAEWLNWLLADNSFWLWTTDTHREVMRLLALQGSHLPEECQKRLEKTVMRGPPQNEYSEKLESDRLRYYQGSAIWLRLKKLQSSGLDLSADAKKMLNDLENQHQHLQLQPHEHEEFLHWMSGTGDPDDVKVQAIGDAPRYWRELISWLREPPKSDSPFAQDDWLDLWRDVCRTRFFHALRALCELAKQGEWPDGAWRTALQAWHEKPLATRSWRYAAPTVKDFPDELLKTCQYPLARWLEATSKERTGLHQDALLSLCHRIIDLPLDPESGVRGGHGEPLGEPITEAINHPAGIVTEALVNLWFQGEPNDGDLLPDTIKPLFTRLCDDQQSGFRYARTILSTNAIALFRVDRAWFEHHLLPFFDWERNAREATCAWAGLLWSGRVYYPLLVTLKAQLLTTASHYVELGRSGEQFAAFLTHIALRPQGEFGHATLQPAFKALPPAGLEEVAQALSQAMERSGDDTKFWADHVLPFWKNVWPQEAHLATPHIAEHLARMCIAAKGEFPEALETIKAWLQPFEHIDYIVHLLNESGLCRTSPKSALALLCEVIDNQPWGATELDECLKAIVEAGSELAHDPCYRRLELYSRAGPQ